jgi:hypothetical protein
LFSREDVANYLSGNFECAWEMVRPVPIVRIDFGDGRVATRTLHGNVASYVCSADGQALDIVPGIYTPAAYTTALDQGRALAAAQAALPADRRLAQLREHHRDLAARLARPGAQPGPNRNPAARERDMGKGTIERRVERVFDPRIPAGNAAAPPRPRNAAELAGWQPLAADTLLNETERRLQIHTRFATADAVRPEQIKRWLYREVLHADLDDPLMGLGDDFFADFES